MARIRGSMVALLAVSCSGTGSVDDDGNPARDGAPPPTDGDVPTEMRPVLDIHNTARGVVNSPAMTWNAALAADAQIWVDGCQFGHDPDWNFQGQAFGENISGGGGGGIDLSSLTRLWVDEEPSYNCTENSCSGECGHYTQVIWRSSLELGCAVATCDGSLFLACRYLPAGNFIGERPVPTGDCQ